MSTDASIDHTPISRDRALAILRQNLGFGKPEQWVDYAVQHSFTRTSATPVPNCPDCGSPPVAQLGQYIYYSTLIRLVRCSSCRLVWSDAHIDPSIVSAHFERSYKDRDYFRNARSRIYRHLAKEISRVTPPYGSVLDVGGAQGDLMHLLRNDRPDITVVVNDISESAVRYAAEEFGLRTIRGDLSALEAHDCRYDVVVLSDVLYFEPRLADFWEVLARLVAPGGSVILRVPNKLGLIRAHQILSAFVRLALPRKAPDLIKHFNPEQIYILTRPYLTARLARLGFSSVRVLPSPLLSLPDSVPRRALARIFFPVAKTISFLSGRRLTASPSLLVIGTDMSSESKPLRN